MNLIKKEFDYIAHKFTALYLGYYNCKKLKCLELDIFKKLK